MKTSQVAKNIAQGAYEPLETLRAQVGKPILEETIRQLGGFVDFGTVSSRPKELAGEDLKRAREQQKLKEGSQNDYSQSGESVEKIVLRINEIKNEYKAHEAKEQKKQEPLHQELTELKVEIAKLAQASGIETKAHLQNSQKKVGVLDIKLLTSIVRSMRVKAEESKSAQELVQQRSNAKRSTGMLAWVSGKQMKVHEQGTLQLQG